jgi:hypothetical protein
MTSTLFGSILYATRPSSSRPAWSVNPTQPQLTICAGEAIGQSNVLPVKRTLKGKRG